MDISEPYTLIVKTPESGGPGRPFFVSNGFAGLRNGHLVAAGAMIKAQNIENARTVFGSGVALFHSADKGRSWQELEFLPLPFPAEVALFEHQARLYMFITPLFTEGDGVLLGAVSDDEGKTWSPRVELLRGPQRWMTSHQLGMAVRDNRLYWATSEQMISLLVLSCDLDKGVLNPHAWRSSKPVKPHLPQELYAGADDGTSKMFCLEGNVLEVEGRLRVVARANIRGTANLAALFDIEDAGGDLVVSFNQYYPLPGGQCKFYIVFDDATGLYWMASNVTACPQKGNDRRNLLLWYSLDSLSWFPAGWIAQAQQLSESFMYPSMVIDGEDLLILSRTSIGSGSFHDADALTFHTVQNFRQLARNQ